jgi:hypothetical protein
MKGESMQAIEVKFIGASNNRGDRLKAFCSAGQITLSIEIIDYKLIDNKVPISNDTRAQWIATELKYKLGWTDPTYGRMVMGTLKNGNYVFVFTGK